MKDILDIKKEKDIIKEEREKRSKLFIEKIKELFKNDEVERIAGFDYTFSILVNKDIRITVLRDAIIEIIRKNYKERIINLIITDLRNINHGEEEENNGTYNEIKVHRTFMSKNMLILSIDEENEAGGIQEDNKKIIRLETITDIIEE